MALLRSADALTQEEGFHLLLPSVGKFSAELINELAIETDDGLKAWLLELLAEARSPAALPSFETFLSSSNAIQRDFAIRGLRNLNSPEASVVLSSHGIAKDVADSLE